MMLYKKRFVIKKNESNLNKYRLVSKNIDWSMILETSLYFHRPVYIFRNQSRILV